MLSLRQIARFFGFLAKDTVKVEPQPVDVLKEKIDSLPPEDRGSVIVKAKEDAWKIISSLESFDQAPPAKELEYLDRLCKNFDILVYLYILESAKNGEVNFRKSFDPEYEKLLQVLPLHLKPLAKPKTDVLTSLESYIEKYEEHILLGEARGEYSISISENRKWIRWPFLDSTGRSKGRVESARQECDKLFYECKSLKTLELETRVPWLDISSLEVANLGLSSAVNIRESAGGKYYTYFI